MIVHLSAYRDDMTTAEPSRALRGRASSPGEDEDNYVRVRRLEHCGANAIYEETR